MKRSWFGLGLLVVLLAVSLAVTWAMDRIHEPVISQLHSAEAAAREENWQEAAALAEKAGSDWEKWRLLRSCFADHSPMEEIDAKFAMLEACVRAGKQEEFPTVAAETAQMVQAMGDAHGLTWGNFF